MIDVPTWRLNLPPLGGMGVVLVPLVMPWAYVWERYVKRPGERWK